MKRYSVLFTLWALQGLLALLWLGLLPSDAGRGAQPGFSTARLALMGLMLALAAGSALLARRARSGGSAPGPRQRDGLALAALLVVPAAALTIGILAALGQTSGFTYGAYATRLAPPAAWSGLCALEFLCLLVWEDRDELAAALAPLRPFLLVSRFSILILFLITIFIAITRLGLRPSVDDGSWGRPATPLLEWQLLLALLAGLAALFLARRWPRLAHERWAFLLVYAFTCLLWLSQPIIPGFFATPPRAPNFEIYPFSDAQIYAQYAQTALTGYGFQWPDVPARPLYIAFLTWLHALAGQDYTHVIALQVLVLAAFPAVLYLLGRELGGRPLGIGLALLAALRELTANAAAPFALNYTYSKLFFSEIPAALLLSLFALLALRWMRGTGNGTAKVPQRPYGLALLAGGVLGLAALIRLQSAFVLVAVVPLAFFVIKERRRWAAGSALMVLGTLLALLPWLARNALATGGLVLDNPTSQAMVLAQRWSGNPDFPNVGYLPGEGEAHYSGRMLAVALQGFGRDPAGLLGAAAQHFINNEIGDLLALPLRDRLASPAELLWPQHAFWQTWSGQPDAGQSALIAGYLVLFGLGLAAAWFRNGPAGLLPLGLSAAYNAWTALFLSSGDRFLVPVDWGVYLYSFLGLLALAGLALTALRSARAGVLGWLGERVPAAAAEPQPAPLAWRGLALSGLLIVCLGATVPLTELAFPKIQFPAAPVAGPGQVALSGQAIYPRYYAAGEGEPGSAKNGYGKSDQARLVFWLAGPRDTLVILPLASAPGFFPNTADVTVVGVQEDGFVNATEVQVSKDGKVVDYGK